MNTKLNIKELLRDKRLWAAVIAFPVLAWLILQLIPIPKDNPPVLSQIEWNSPQTEQLARDACFDCHSNETKWVWYSDVAPMRLLVRNHVTEGRGELNFSEMPAGSIPIREIAEAVGEGEMPPWDYRLIHPEARLTDEQKQLLIDGLRNSTVLADQGR